MTQFKSVMTNDEWSEEEAEIEERLARGGRGGVRRRRRRGVDAGIFIKMISNLQLRHINITSFLENTSQQLES